MSDSTSVFTLLIIALTCLMSWLAFRNPVLEDRYIFDPQAILAGKEYFRLLSSGFLHSGWAHLLFNMMSLYCFGRYLESVFGARDFLLIYFGGMVGGNLLSLYLHRHHQYRAYGASGGVYGVILGYILLFPGAMISDFLFLPAIPGWLYAIGFIIASFIALKTDKDNIGHDAHLGGGIIGLLIAAALHPWFARENWVIFLAVLSGAVLLLIYFWFNPLLLPVASFIGSRAKRKSPSKSLPQHKRETVQIDAILEKINVSGLDSLSLAERELLQNTSEKFQSRATSKKPESGLTI